jgi:Uncharacterized protein conserved in bacteria
LHLIFANLSAVIGNVKAGSLRALAITSAQRAATAPEVPTIAEVALPASTRRPGLHWSHRQERPGRSCCG